MTFNLPEIEHTYLKMPLYENIALLGKEHNDEDILEASKFVALLEYYENPLECFCPECGKNSIFKNAAKKINHAQPPDTPFDERLLAHVKYRLSTPKLSLLDNRIFSVAFECVRHSEHRIYFIFAINSNKLIKIGQYPSLKDFEKDELRKYQRLINKKLFDDVNFKEFRTGIGLNAHGIGIGAFVYLRRVFENLIEEAHCEASRQIDWDEDTFLKSRMDEKIALLRNYLPRKLFKMKALYPILSKGIHQLIEDECLKYFPVLKGGIELILEERLQQIYKLEKEAKEKEIEVEISKIHGKLSADENNISEETATNPTS